MRRDNAWYLRNSNTTGDHDIVFLYGLPSDVPVVGDWDGDGNDTVGVVRNTRGAGTDWDWYLNNTNTEDDPEYIVTFGFSATDRLIVGDWDGDGDDTVGVVRGSEWLLSNILGRQRRLERGAGLAWAWVNNL